MNNDHNIIALAPRSHQKFACEAQISVNEGNTNRVPGANLGGGATQGPAGQIWPRDLVFDVCGLDSSHPNQ